jgi:DNA-binding NtrC family response regulator
MPPRPLQVVLSVFNKATAGLLASHLEKLGCDCHVAESLAELTRLVKAKSPELMVLQISKAATDANKMVTIQQVHVYIAAATVVALAAPDPELFFQAAKAGVEAVLTLPLDPSVFRRTFHDILGRLQASEPSPSLALPSDTSSSIHTSASANSLHTTIPSLFAMSEEMAEVREMIEKVAPTSAAVLIRGESGVGKELAARMIHSYSLRAEKAFVKVNCAAIPNDLLESELFGYEAGAFTGATKSKPGKFEIADGGTIFLDEIGEMHPMLQAKLLHVLQDGDFARLGSKRDISVDVRVICATNQQLDQLVAKGQFREDLYYRVNVVTVSVPPLRARKREIPILLGHFVQHYAEIYGKPAAPFDKSTIELLTQYDWPGNIRELENLCKRYVIVGNTTQIVREMKSRQAARTLTDNPEKSARLTEGRKLSPHDSQIQEPTELSLLAIGRRAAWAAERKAIECMLRETRWNRREAARRLQVSYKALLNKIQVMESEAAGIEVVSN